MKVKLNSNIHSNILSEIMILRENGGCGESLAQISNFHINMGIAAQCIGGLAPAGISMGTILAQIPKLRSQCTMQLSPCKRGNQRFEPNFHHSPHFPIVSLYQRKYLSEYLSSVSLSFYFLAVQLFQTEIFGDRQRQLLRFTFDLYLGTS